MATALHQIIWFYQTIRRSPTDLIYKSDGSFETDRSSRYFNPVAIIKDIQNQRDAKRYYGNLRTEVNILHNLKGAINLGYIRNDEKFLFRAQHHSSIPPNMHGEYTIIINRASLNPHSNTNWPRSSADADPRRSLLPDWFLWWFAACKGCTIQLSNPLIIWLHYYYLNQEISYKNEALLVSFFGRVHIGNTTANIIWLRLRRDGSSKFGKNKWMGWFPAVSAAQPDLRIFYAKSRTIQCDLKLRQGRLRYYRKSEYSKPMSMQYISPQLELPSTRRPELKSFFPEWVASIRILISNGRK